MKLRNAQRLLGGIATNNRSVFSFMNTEIAIALITGLCAVAGNYLISRKSAREDAVRDAQREQKQMDLIESIEEKFNTVEKKLDEHNGYAEKFGQVSTAIAEIKKDIEYLKRGNK